VLLEELVVVESGGSNPPVPHTPGLMVKMQQLTLVVVEVVQQIVVQHKQVVLAVQES
jgi:hypothetical protein